MVISGRRILRSCRSLRSVLELKAQVVCVDQPLLIVGDVNADPGVIPCLAKGISSRRFVDLALAYSVGAGKEPDMTCKFKFDECAGSWRDFVVACSNSLAASTACEVTERCFTPSFSIFAEFNIRQRVSEVFLSWGHSACLACLLG